MDELSTGYTEQVQQPSANYYGDSMGGSYRQTQDSDLIKFQLNPQEILDGIEATLRGQVYDVRKEEWLVPQGRKPLMNEKGIATLMNVVIRPRVNKNVYLTNLTQDEIDKIMFEMMISIIENLFMNHRGYEINKDSLTLVVKLIEDNVKFSLNRALNEGERNFLKTTESTKQVITLGQQPQPTGTSKFFKKIGEK